MNQDTKLSDILKDFENGLNIMNKFKKPAITVFGSARIKSDNKTYIDTVELSERISRELKFNIITGGGPGIMEAANKGSHKVEDTESIGIGIILPFEETENLYTSVNEQFKYFFSRKVMLINYSRAYIAMQGGFGTLDEVFEVLTLMQTKKIPKSKIYLVDVEFYTPLMEFIKSSLLKNNLINKEDLDLLVLTDDFDFIIQDLGKIQA